MSDNLPAAPGGEFILYQTEDGRTRLEVRFKGETVWLSLNQMATLFQRDKSVISRHIKNIFDEGELVRSAVVAESATTAADGKMTFYASRTANCSTTSARSVRKPPEPKPSWNTTDTAP